ncbi:DNA polymerase III subunit alpha [Candidatus Dojkabacteria bacterium]|nr:DNA polymerase III subunit alpha [Candidatus Dojkabacteria bacterium]
MFTHLHLHTEFSLLDGLSKIKKLSEYAAETGMKSMAITDHGVMYGAHKFYEACKENEIKPIIGCEVYVAPRKRSLKVPKLDESPNHLVLIAENKTGYKNLLKLVSIAHTEGFYYKPRIDKELLEQYHEGIIALSACLAGPIAQPIMNGKKDKALEEAQWYSNLFGKDHFYIEIQRNGIAEQEPVNKGLIDLARELKLPLIATCDSHYMKKENGLAQEVLMCINTGKLLEDTDRMSLEAGEFYVKTPEEMEKLFSDIPEVIKNSEDIAERCNVEIEPEGWVFPNPYIPESYKGDYDKYFYDLIFQRGKKVLGREFTEEEKTRAEYEFNIFKDKGFSSYMILVMGFTDWIRENNVPHTTRGSAAGSMCGYCVGIVTAHPLKFNLPFERFLNPLRPKAPDIDLDVASSRREELIEYAIKAYGKENVAHIATFGRMQARGSIRDAGRVLGLPLSYVDRIAKMIPASGQGLAKVDINRAISEVPELEQLIKEDADAARLIDIAKSIEGVAKSQGVHACGILITPNPIVDYVPVIWDKTLGSEGRMITQYEMDSLENLGLMKMDFLGLTNLDTLSETVKLIKREHDVDIDLHNLDLEDKDTFKLVRSLDTLGVFQFETGPMKQTTKTLQPETIFDMSAALALVRPGPNQNQQSYADRKSGKEKIVYLDNRMAEYLELTFGVLVYQEDIIRTVIHLGGMDWGEADRVRKATGKKKPDVLFEMKDEIIERFVKNKVSEENANKIFEQFIPFTNYAFNQAHAAAYSLVCYQSAYLKAHYPVEFMAGLLKSEIENFDKVSEVIAECNRKGIKILPPDINKSNMDFSIENKKNIRFGLAGIKSLGNAAVELIIKEREEKGEFKNLDELFSRIPLSVINQKQFVLLTQAGAFDNFGERNAVLSIIPNLYEKYKKDQLAAKEGQFDIFSIGIAQDEVKEVEQTPLPQVPAAKDSEKIEWEKTLLGFFLTAHPIEKIQPYLKATGTGTIAQAKEKGVNQNVQVCGLITRIKRITTKKNQSMAFLEIEDQTGSLEVIVFPKSYTEISDKLVENAPVMFTGKINIRDNEKSLILDNAEIVDIDKATKTSEGIHLRIPANADPKLLHQLKVTLLNNNGDTTVTLHIAKDGDIQIMQLKKGIEMNENVKEVITPFRID